eukprot:scaffold5135_cov131-Skeletonema_dohrnii-CCMP3373.AAC.3
MELSEYHSWEKDFESVCLNIDIVSIFFPTRAEGRERAIGWAGTPRLVASGGGRHRFRATGKDRAQFPGRNLGGFAKP